MWLHRAASLPWQLLGAATLLSVSVVVSPYKVLTSILRLQQQRPTSPKATRIKDMPKEYYDVNEVSSMLKMVRAAMLDTSGQLHTELQKVSQLSQQVDELRENLENVNYLFVEEQQHRLDLQAELNEAEIAAADLRQALTIYFGESHHGSPNSSPDNLKHHRGPHSDVARAPATSSQLSSGLPGTLNRADSRLQVELAGIQNRLKKIAQLRDVVPSSPRSADRISPWLSLSAGGSPSGELSRLRTLGRMSPVKLSPLKADSSPDDVKDSEVMTAAEQQYGLLSGLAFSNKVDAASDYDAQESCQAALDADAISCLADAVSLDKEDKLNVLN